ncbi:HAMP domain-containing protein [Pseudonocardia xinjiangensis]|uniref:HAMP domain-containing protein n=1 Tax=Pseudonocardia xinjiangensis TaxID=75289 RepID=A0ABX1R7Y3_9PSEU|nr:HAMP domain-containing protein [Pseudonocardia xinjiangensis]NMH76458.1 HAMP domain-containing protein [Pseudonocardia xinjiangensis]
MSTPRAPQTLPDPDRGTSAPLFPNFPRRRFPAGVSGGPLAVLTVLLAAAATLVAVAIGGDGRWPDWRIPGTLVLVATVGHVLLWSAVVNPVQRIRDATARMAVEDSAAVVPRVRPAELDRIAAALHRFAGLPARARAHRVRISLAVAPCVVAVLVLAWAVPAAVMTVGGAASQPDTVVRQAGEGASARAEKLQAALRGGLAVLQRAADPPTGAEVADAARTAAQVLAAEGLFRSVWVVDGSGRRIAAAGRPPSAPVTAPPRELRVVQANRAGSEPLVLASAPMWDGATSLVAEFDPRALNDLIRTAGVHTWVVDVHRATVLDSSGYTAFAPLDDPALAALAGTALADVPAVATPGNGEVNAAQRVSTAGAPTDLGWVLVENQDVAVTAFTHDGNRRVTFVVIALGASLALGSLAWVMVTVVAPARRLARHVERLAGGDAVPPLAPQRLDEIGSVVAATNRFVGARALLGATARS